ncbi:MAG: glycosyltransferase [Nevskia sp.]|nr:glycosyltransferase [Nevskia sp.]
MKLGIVAAGLTGWAGGLDFLRMIMDSLYAAGNDVELHLLVPAAGPLINLRNLKRAMERRTRPEFPAPAAELKRYHEFFAEQFPQLHIHVIDLGPLALARAAGRLRLDCLLPAMDAPGPVLRQPWLGYIYDLQHRHYPDFFSRRQRRVSDARFTGVLRRARAVLVNARAVADDIHHFYPGYRTRLVALPFAPAPRREWLEALPGVVEKYGIGDGFFLISNQFWLHKNHRCAFEALALLRHRSEVELVCTGDTHDYRHPRHFQELRALLDRHGVAGRVRILGHIPKREQMELVKRCVAVIQPSLVEGGPGGGAAYDAVSVDTPLLLSDIPVNREIESGYRAYFRPDSPEELAHRMEQALALPQRVPAEARADSLLQAGRSRRRQCGEVILEAIAAVSG